MGELMGSNEIESIRADELSEIGPTSFRHHHHNLSFRSNNSVLSSITNEDDFDEDYLLQWAAIERLPTFDRLRSAVFDENKRVVDVTTGLGGVERHMFIDKLIKHIEHDNLRLLKKIRKRIDRAGVKLPSLEVRYVNLHVEVECEVVHGKPLPTLWNSFKSLMMVFARRIPCLESKVAKIKIVNDVSGVIKPGRMTLLLGPPGCGKTSLLKALSANLRNSLKVRGEISYNGHKFQEFVPQKTSAYISQYDLHIPEMTVRETLDFSSCCQGVGSRADILVELIKMEKELGIVPDQDIDIYMKAISVEGQKTNLQTDYILKILGLDVCADTIVGNAMRRGISGGQKKRLTTGEMIVGPTKALFMDEISNGLDSSTTYQIVACLQQLAQITDATILMSLLQPAPEVFDLFDDIILMAEGKVIFHGPRSNILEFFENCGFKCPERKGVADFLQEVISRKDQAQYWNNRTQEAYSYVSVDTISTKFKESPYGNNLFKELSVPYDKSKSHKNAINSSVYSLPKWTLFRACISREFLLMKRNSFIYIFKSVQLITIAFITITVFSRTRMDVDLLHANYYLGALFYALLILLVDGLPELSMTVTRLEVFFKQRELCFYPAWAYAIPTTILKFPLSLLESVVWTSITYYAVGFSPEVGRFFRQLLVFFAVHMSSISLFRFLAAIFPTVVVATTVGNLSIMFVLLFGGFIISRPSMSVWLKWGFWVSPISYGEIGLALNEFLAPRWEKMSPTNMTIGEEVLESRGLNFDGYLYWVSIGALFGFTILFNLGFTLALSFLKPPGSRAIISKEKFSKIQGSRKSLHKVPVEEKTSEPSNPGRVILPFEALSVVFQDVQYYIDMPVAMKECGFTEKRLQLLSNITAALRPGVLTALMGVSGAGKTTLLDVLSGRKTSGTVEGEIRIGGYPKVQETFARVSGYCEQTDIHSPQITVEESVIFSAWLRLPPEIDSKTKSEFVKEVIETIELDGIKDMLVGMPGISGLSTEQRKRLTIAVELVANPSIIFMDEPTTGLDARAAAIVMRAVKNVVGTGRTIVCTIHQPSIDIFEAFDELILLKTGGKMIYWGPLGWHSCKMIDYFEGISGVPKIKDNYNPATWMLEVTSTFAEAELGLDFAEIYQKSSLYKNNKELVKMLSVPRHGSKQLHFPTPFSQKGWGQFKTCLWKQYWSYWRSPSYNLMRFIHMLIVSLLLGLLFWDQGKKIENQQSLLNILGSMFTAVMQCGINNCSTVLPYVSTERTVLYRDRFAGMYASWAYALAQVIVEIPYLFAQTVVFTGITYPMIGYYGSAHKVLWYFYAMFCTLLYFNYLGMLLIAMTPSFHIAATLQSAFYSMFNLFAGLMIRKPQIPKWWVWFYYLIPTSWSLNCMLSSQYGDVEEEIMVFGEKKTVAAFLRDYFGYHHHQLPIVAAMLILFPLLFACLFTLCIQKLNFQRR
ncbi:PREDICTED: pleiotropic drug resistance protein 3-like isoform X1 [Ipomoea nil]|uniref:pleiotropic drug resistance protein 3-like isoform X1 n=2 Tax=Ipomoea nil TaxID=35883 RepID=UPI000900CEA4|nr:PREDICTED: pleiotropic drug resistance protein 3-like isoform X1 [Ipomoea nil]